MPLIDPGQKAPLFTLPDQSGREWSLGECRGSPVVIFFYPKDSTSACTAEACQFQDLAASFRRRGAKVVGVSILDSRSKKAFAGAHGLRFPLLADDATGKDGKPCPIVSRRYGVWGEKSMYGRAYMGIIRTTYLVGADGRVRRRWDKVRVPGHAEEVLAALSEPDP